jgi:lipooligosaccharide transport system permease protein
MAAISANSPAAPPATGPAGTGPASSGPASTGLVVLAVRAFRFWLVNYRRTWRGSIYTSVTSPVLYLGAMGLGLGTLVNARGSGQLGGVSYLAFLAPGLLAATAMQTALGESTYPVLASVKWLKTFQAAAATPLRPADLFHGHLLFTSMRLLMNTAIFLAVMAAFGAVTSWWVLATIPVCLLTGIAFATPIEAFAVTRDKDGAFAILYRFGLIPLFLFSGTFFPLSQLPEWLRPVAYATPLWHGVALCRSLSLGTADLSGSLVHVAYLVALALAGLAVGQRTYRRRLYV